MSIESALEGLEGMPNPQAPLVVEDLRRFAHWLAESADVSEADCVGKPPCPECKRLEDRGVRLFRDNTILDNRGKALEAAVKQREARIEELVTHVAVLMSRESEAKKRVKELEAELANSNQYGARGEATIAALRARLVEAEKRSGKWKELAEVREVMVSALLHAPNNLAALQDQADKIRAAIKEGT